MRHWPYPRVAAHRGGGTLAPENTMAAMRCGFDHGFRAVEFDVMLAQDGVPVVLHDHRLGRTVPGTAEVATLTWSQLTAMDAGSWFGAAYCDETVPMFEQVFRFCSERHIWMNIEIKPSPGTEHQTGHIVAGLAQQWVSAYDENVSLDSPLHSSLFLLPLLSSFSFDALIAAQTAAPDLPRGWLVDQVPADWLARLQSIDAMALHVNQKNLTQALVEQIKTAGFNVFCYTVNDVARAAELFGWGVDALCTDRLDLIAPGFGCDYVS